MFFSHTTDLVYATPDLLPDDDNNNNRNNSTVKGGRGRAKAQGREGPSSRHSRGERQAEGDPRTEAEVLGRACLKSVTPFGAG